MFGFNYRYEMVMAGATFITDLLSPGDANTGANKPDLKDADILLPQVGGTYHLRMAHAGAFHRQPTARLLERLEAFTAGELDKEHARRVPMIVRRATGSARRPR